MTAAQHLARLLDADSGVDAAYQHRPKHVTPGEPLELEGALLKWYGLHPAEQPIPDELTGLARARLVATPLEARGLGLVVLHRCRNDFYFLIVCTWRNDNELWTTVFYKEAAMSDFAVFPRDDAHKPVLCVWELVPVWHEQQAWTRFLRSTRDEPAGRAWLADVYAGAA